MDHVIVADKLVKAFGLRPVLRGISFSVARGATVSVLGANGSGKTTLLRILSGLSRPTAGTLSIGGWTLPKEAWAVRMQLGVVGHQPILHEDLTAEENVRFFARLYSVEKPIERTVAVLERVGLARRSKDLLRTFSRGMQQRLAIARAMVHDPAIFLLDEPYTGLDVNGVTMLDELLREWKASGRTIVMTSHNLEHASAFSHQVIILSRGKIALDAEAATIDNLPALFEQVTVASQ
jgi:heme exporter protein A